MVLPHSLKLAFPTAHLLMMLCYGVSTRSELLGTGRHLHAATGPEVQGGRCTYISLAQCLPSQLYCLKLFAGELGGCYCRGD